MDSTATGEMRLTGAGGAGVDEGDGDRPEPADTRLGTALPPAPEILQQVANEVRAWFPRRIEGPELVLIDVDPRVLHAFWSLPLSLVQNARAMLGAAGATAPLVLRLEAEEVDDAPPAAAAVEAAVPAQSAARRETFDVIVSGLQSRAYIDIDVAARRWRATLGIKRGDGTLIVFAHSNSAALPPLGPAPLTAPAVDAQVGPQAVAAHAEPATSEPQPAAAAAAAPAGEAAPAPEAAPATEAATERAATVGGEPAAAPEAKPLVEASAGEPFALEEILPLSSFVLSRSGDDVALEVTAELFIHGRTQPGRTLQLFGKDIRVRPDGTFALRRILPNDPSVLAALLASEEADTAGGES